MYLHSCNFWVVPTWSNALIVSRFDMEALKGKLFPERKVIYYILIYSKCLTGDIKWKQVGSFNGHLFFASQGTIKKKKNYFPLMEDKQKN